VSIHRLDDPADLPPAQPEHAPDTPWWRAIEYGKTTMYGK
jgi:hypothetical protein